jgi:hypothetical protein
MEIAILVVAGAIVYLAFVIKKRNKNTAHNSNRAGSIEELEQRAEYYKKSVFEENHLGLDFKTEHSKLVAMEKDFLRLRERFKHDAVKIKMISEDWFDYCYAMWEIKHAQEMLDVDLSDNAYENFEDSSKEFFIKVQEIEKRFEEMLENDATISHVNKTIFEKQKTFDSVIEKQLRV